jgi:prolyl-tRNA editing enzyme YbaK/EbsC (Cys-tRNA(Pro) deacylase)
MKPAAERVQKILQELGLDSVIVEFSESTKTSAEAAAAIGTTVAQIAKSILFAAAEQPIMVIASGINRIDTAKVQAHVGATLGKANAAFVRDHTGYVIGGVPPVGHAVKFAIFIDQDLLQYAEIWAAGGTPNTVFRLTPTELVRITAGTIIDCKEEINT